MVLPILLLDDILLNLVILAKLLTGKVVAPSRTTIVVPSITVVLSDTEKFGFTAMVVGTITASIVVSLITIKEPDIFVGEGSCMGSVVGPGITR
jgi:hypothetical protein